MTVEELAAASGMTVRNIREHQTRGLMPPPEVEGRKGYYDERHLRRLRLIRTLQDEGLNLQAIAWLLERAPAEATEEIARFRMALFAPWSEEQAAAYTPEELAQRLGVVPQRVLQRAEALGLIHPMDDGRYEVVSPRLLEVGRELREVGVSVDAALDVYEDLRRHAEAVAERFTDLFAEEIWAPFEEKGRPAAGWADVREALERMRSTAIDALLAVFARTMSEAVAERSRVISEDEQRGDGPMASGGSR